MLKLKTAAQIGLMIQDVGKKGKTFAALVHNTAMQTLLHAEKHGDATLADKLVKTLKDTTPGYVWQGLVLWFTKNSPIRWDAEGKVSLLKPDEKGYKKFDAETAESTPAAAAREVSNRTDTEIKPFSISMVKDRINGMLKQLDKATAEGGRGVVGDPETIRTFIKGIVAYADKVAVVEATAPKSEAAKAPIEGNRRKAA